MTALSNRGMTALVCAMRLLVVASVCGSSRALAQTPIPPDTVVKMRGVKVTAKRPEEVRTPVIQAMTMPVTSSVTAQQVERTVNVVDPEDAVKYMPSVFLRKRNNG